MQKEHFWIQNFDKNAIYPTTQQFISVNQKHFNQIQVVTNETTNITCKLKFTVITAFKISIHYTKGVI